ncbi:MAG TPA: hypothetical protein PKJ97_01315, partial [Candidatus Bilamarchaeaceae archaeon]|nr:hypothetical protein [Candidatus Bilamarchaeaceae archaeon]
SMPRYFSEDELGEVEPHLIHMETIRTHIWLLTTVPEREAEQRRQEGLEAWEIEPASRPAAPVIDMPTLRQYLSQSQLDTTRITMPSQWDSHFQGESRERTAREISDGYMEQIFSNDPRRGPTDASRAHGQQVLTEIANSVQEACGGTFTTDMLLDPSTWNDEQRRHLMNMLGHSGMGEERLAEILRMIGEGDFLGAFQMAPPDSTIGMALQEDFRETLNQRFSMHAPIFGIALEAEANLLERQISSFSTLRVPVRGVLRVLLSGIYRPEAAFQRDDDGNITGLDLNLRYSGELMREVGGILGGGGEIGAEFTLGHEQRYVGMYAMVQYNPQTERPEFTGRAQFTDRSGEWTTPLDGVIYPTVYGGATTDFEGSSGEAYGGAMIEAGSSYFVFGDVSFFIIAGGEYRYRWGAGIEPSQSAPLQAGVGMSVGDVFRTDGRFVWDPLSESDRPVGAMWQGVLNLGAGFSTVAAVSWFPVTFDMVGNRQQVDVVTGTLNLRYSADEPIFGERAGQRRERESPPEW